MCLRDKMWHEVAKEDKVKCKIFNDKIIAKQRKFLVGEVDSCSANKAFITVKWEEEMDFLKLS